MAIIKSEAIVLKTDNYRYTSKLVTFFSNEFGKIKCIAKGVRDVKSKYGSVLMPFSHLNIIFYYKENKTLHLLSNAEHINLHNKLINDFDKLQVGFKSLELINITSDTQHQNQNIFKLLDSFLVCLNDAKSNYDEIFIYFETCLLNSLGYQIDFNSFNLLKDNKKQNYTYTYNSHLSGENRQFSSKHILTIQSIELLDNLNNWNFNKNFDFNISKRELTDIRNFFDEYFLIHLGNFEKLKTNRVIN
jgi:DNA repair protein RecO (recombination protein O)